MKTYTGQVKWYNTDDGYGYIAVDLTVKAEWHIPTDRDLFFHKTGLIGKYPKPVPEAGQPCQFNIQDSAKGARAFNIVLRCPERRGAQRSARPTFPAHVID